MNDREKLQLALDTLTQQGYETHARFLCCMSCGLAALEEETTRYVFWHEQDDASAFGMAGSPFGYDHEWEETTDTTWTQYTTLQHPLYLRWGGDAQVIRAAFAAQGYRTSWEGTAGKAIVIHPKRVGYQCSLRQAKKKKVAKA